MLNHITKCDSSTIVLGEDAEQELEFYSAIVHLNYTVRVDEQSQESSPDYLGIAICSEGHGLKPHLVLLPRQTLAVGFNREVVGISVSNKQILFRLRFDTLFRSFLYLDEMDTLLVFNEIGVVALAASGVELWRYEKDIITDCLINEGKLYMNFMDSPQVMLRLSSGAIE
jgi:hypothetical protein